jgi:hypothetical protein
MGFKFGFVLGAGVGFLAGSKAGPDAFDKVRNKVDDLRNRPEVNRFADDLKSRAEDTVSTIKDKVDEKVGGSSGESSGNGHSTGGSESPQTNPGAHPGLGGEPVPGLVTPGGYQPGPSPTGGPQAHTIS